MHEHDCPGLDLAHDVVDDCAGFFGLPIAGIHAPKNNGISATDGAAFHGFADHALGRAEERWMVSERGLHDRLALFQLLGECRTVHFGQPMMRIGVVSDLMPAPQNLFCNFGVILYIRPDHEKGRFDPVAVEDIQNAIGVGGMRTVIKGERDFSRFGVCGMVDNALRRSVLRQRDRRQNQCKQTRKHPLPSHSAASVAPPVSSSSVPKR